MLKSSFKSISKQALGVVNIANSFHFYGQQKVPPDFKIWLKSCTLIWMAGVPLQISG